MNEDSKKKTLAERFKALPPEAKKQVLESLNQIKSEREKEARKQKFLKDMSEKFNKKDKNSQ